MSEKYKCQLCYMTDNTNQLMNAGSFLRHLVDTHNSPKAKDMILTLHIFGSTKEDIDKELKENE